MKSAELLEMELAYNTEEIVEAVKATVKANNIGRGLIKIMAFWGEESIIQLVLDSKLDVAIFAIPESEELVLDKNQTISVCLSKWRKIHPETIPVGAKACSNYLNGYLARKNAVSRSVFIVKDGVLMTPPLGRVLSSITRLSILQSAPQADIPTVERPITADELFAADEMFTVHTGAKVEPVARFEDRELQAPGPVTKQVMQLMDDILQFKNQRFRDWFQPLT